MKSCIRDNKYARSISLWGQKGNNKQLNRSQVEAMMLSVENSFQLIQGPPGNCAMYTLSHYTKENIDQSLC